MPISHASPTSNGRILCVPNQNLTPRSQRSQRFLNPFIPQFPFAFFARESASRNCGAWENPNCPTYRVTLILMNSLPNPVACTCFFTKPSGEVPVLGLTA